MAGPLDDDKNKQKLNWFIAEHAPLINMHANKLKSAGYLPPDVDVNDIHMAGVHGLMDALSKYNRQTGGGKKFSSYAQSRIRGAMLDHLSKHRGIPKHVINQAKNLRSMDAQAVKPQSTESPQSQSPQIPEKPKTPQE